MRYHDASDDIRVTNIQRDRELRWYNLIRKWTEDGESWSLQEVNEVFRDLQEFMCLDFPSKKHLSKEQIITAFDNVARASVAIVEVCMENKTDPLEYVTKKLIVALESLMKENGQQKTFVSGRSLDQP
ncbi:hypothetical protein MTBGP_09510 [Moorella thermoacetica]|uniref:hypothetical protein n=1 Tax=Neomoorella thermoacetica TaxID=1525 RepID=UPI0030D4B8A6